MSYRTYVNDVQIFGNNECYPEWIDFIKSQGIPVGDDDEYDGEITDVTQMFAVVDKIIRDKINYQHQRVLNKETCYTYNGVQPVRELTDFSGDCMLDDEIPILRFNKYLIDNSYLFMPYLLYTSVEKSIENTYEKEEIHGIRFFKYTVKEGEHIRVHAG